MREPGAAPEAAAATTSAPSANASAAFTTLTIRRLRDEAVSSACGTTDAHVVGVPAQRSEACAQRREIDRRLVELLRERAQLARLLRRVAALQSLRDLLDALLDPPLLGL